MATCFIHTPLAGGLLHPARLVLRSSVILQCSEDYQIKETIFVSHLVFSVPVFRRPLKIESRIFFSFGVRCSGLPKTHKNWISDFFLIWCSVSCVYVWACMTHPFFKIEISDRSPSAWIDEYLIKFPVWSSENP